MPMASLSRWTMSYFAAALAFLLAAEAFAVTGIGYPAAGLAEPATLVLVHLVAIGWLSLAMAGALLQFVPVLVSRPLAFSRLALPVLFALVAGLILLCAGFDPTKGQYTPAVWAGLRAGGLATVLLLGGAVALLAWRRRA